MKINGEYLFTTFEEALAFVNKPTNYEINHNIEVLSSVIKFNNEKFKVVSRKTSDGREGIFLFFKNSTIYDIWKFWCPDEEQFYCLSALPLLINVLEIKNATNKLI